MPAEIQFDTYYPYQPLTEILQSLAEENPHLLKLESIGKSYEGRDVWCAIVSNHSMGNHAERPAFWCDGNIHATEVSASSACLYLIHKLVSQYGCDANITRTLDTRTFYIVPRVNPDGAELYFADKPKHLRSSVRPYPYDEEPLEGLIPEDMNGDGRMLQMRVPDPNGTWKAHSDEPRLLIQRDPTETGGTYYRLLPEGRLENYDGVTFEIAKRKEGLDLNRNFPAHWRQEGEQVGAGNFPGSEPEVYNLIKFITAHPNITGGMTFHTFSGVLLRPYGTESDETFPAEDLWTYKAIGKKGTELTGYPAISVFHDFKYHPKEVITGVFDDWMYEHLGVFAWTVEIWSPHRQAGLTEGFNAETKAGAFKFIEWYRDHPVEDDLKMLKWADESFGGEGFVEWKPFEHPQLGKVEIGGWNVQLAFRNPPPNKLEAEIAPLADWAIWHALISPEICVTSAMATKLSDGAYLVQMVIDNVGWLPTYVTKKALEKKTVRALVVEIELPEGATLKSGKARQEAGQLEGKAYKGVSPYGWASDPTTERAKIEWIVTAEAGTTVKLIARHERAGTVRTEITL